MLPYLTSVESLKPRFAELAAGYPKGWLMPYEYAAAFYYEFTNLANWASVSDKVLNELLDEVFKLPVEVRVELRKSIEKRRINQYSPMKGLGVRMPETEQRERIPFLRDVSEALLGRLDSCGDAEIETAP